MRFCVVCRNMYYIKLSDDDNSSLIYYCKKCGDESQTVTDENICVSKTHYNKKTQNVSALVNKYTKHDPTLPRIYNMKCPNVDCPTNEETNTECEIVSLRYDTENMKYLYICKTCDCTWKNSEY